jgi:hypothetical protein
MIRRRGLWPPHGAGVEAPVLGEVEIEIEVEVRPLQNLAGRLPIRVRLPVEDLVQVHAPGALDVAHASLEGELQVPRRAVAMEA